MINCPAGLAQDFQEIALYRLGNEFSGRSDYLIADEFLQCQTLNDVGYARAFDDCFKVLLSKSIFLQVRAGCIDRSIHPITLEHVELATAAPHHVVAATSVSSFLISDWQYQLRSTSLRHMLLLTCLAHRSSSLPQTTSHHH
jgi:hypothetical protein